MRIRPKDAVANLRALLDGARYSRTLAPAVNETAVSPESPGRLAQYFEANTEGPGIWKWRHYFPIYERHFQRFVGREVHVAEIGVYSGGSLMMWREYFGDAARVYGIDVQDACRAYAGDRIDIFIGDQADPSFWREFLNKVPRLDILIDDGGHRDHQQIATLKAVLPAISPGGVYVCEDLHGPARSYHTFVDSLSRALHDAHPAREPAPFHQHVESIHHYPFMTVIEKPLLPTAPFLSLRRGTEWEPFLDRPGQAFAAN